MKYRHGASNNDQEVSEMMMIGPDNNKGCMIDAFGDIHIHMYI